MPILKFEYGELELKELIIADLEKKLGEVELDAKKVSIKVKSKQNWKSEWEEAAFMATYEGSI